MIIVLTYTFVNMLQELNQELYELERGMEVMKTIIEQREHQLQETTELLLISEEYIEELEVTIQELRTIPAIITNYAPLDPNAVEGMCYSGNPNITATGTQVRRGVAAADPRRIPYGTRLWVPDFGEVVVEDTGGAMRNNDRIHIDIFVESRKDAFAFGIQEREITILD